MTAPSQNTWDAPKPAVDANDSAAIAASATAARSDSLTSSARPAPSQKGASEQVPRKGLGLGTKASILAGIFGMLPVLAVGILSYRSADSSITERIAQQEIGEAEQLSDQLQQYLQERRANVLTMADTVRDFGLLEEVAPSDSEENSEAEARTDVEETIVRELTDFVQNYRTYANVAVLSLQGDVIVQSEGSARELNQSEALYFQEVLETRRPVVSEPVLAAEGSSDDRLAIYVAAPILDEGALKGVVSAKIPVDFIGSAVLLRTASSGDGTVYRLVDSSGTIIQSLPATADETELGRPITNSLADFAEVNTVNQVTGWIEAGEQGDLLNAYAPMKGFANLDWSIVTSTDTNIAFLPQRQLLETILIGTAITGIVSVLMGIVLAKRATKPVEQAAETVELLGQGKLHARMKVKGRDELAILGFNVNRMAEQIQALLQTLSQNAKQLGKQNDVLAKLARNDGLIQGDAQTAAEAFTEAISATLNIQRVSIWIDQPEEKQFRCLGSYDRGHGAQQQLPLMAVSTYFQLVADSQGLALTDIRSEEAIGELIAGNYLAPGTVSLLEVPIQISGVFVGTVRCEHTGELREWQPQEQTFVSSVANLISLALESEVLQEEVSHLLDVVSEVEDGNLIVQAQVSDRTTGLVADTFNRLIERLSGVMQQVVDTTRQVSTKANQQQTEAALVASNAERQAQEVKQVLQLTEQVEEMAQGSAQLVQASNQSLQTVQGSVEQGQQAITNLMRGIGILQEGSDRIIQQMKTLGEFVGLADQFVQDQSQIASLTQTLALNASLVSARAAEQRDPRQFAVAAREFNSIATQVSQLAQQTNNSLTSLEQRSAQIHSVVSAIDADVQGLGSLVKGFTQGVEQSSQVFSNVQVGTVEAVTAGDNISRSSVDIVKAAQSAADVVRDIARIATTSAELTQRSSQQANQMDQLSTQLLQTVEFFQLPERTANADVLDIEATPVQNHLALQSAFSNGGSTTVPQLSGESTAAAASLDEIPAPLAEAAADELSETDLIPTMEVSEVEVSESDSDASTDSHSAGALDMVAGTGIPYNPNPQS